MAFVTLQRRWGLNFSYCPVWRNLKLIVHSSVCAAYSALSPVACEELEVLTVHRGQYWTFHTLTIAKISKILSNVNLLMSIPVASRSKAWVCGLSLAGIVGSNPAGAWKFFPIECCGLSFRYLWDGPITRSEESYQLRVYLTVIVKPRQWEIPGPLGLSSHKNSLINY